MQRSTTIMVPCVDEKSVAADGKVAGDIAEGPTLHYTGVLPSKYGCKLPMSQALSQP